MTQFKDFDELADPLILPIKGKLYTIPPVGAADGIRFNLAADPTVKDASPISDEEFFRIFLGTAYDEMVADNIPGAALIRAAYAALADFQSGRGAAVIMWETGGDPKAIEAYSRAHAPNRAARRSKPTAAANSTKRPASTSGTKPRQA